MEVNRKDGIKKYEGSFKFRDKLTKKERFDKAKKSAHLLSQLDNAFSESNDNTRN